MRVIFEAASQGATLRVYHHGYITIDPGLIGSGWQLYPDDLEALIEALREAVAQPASIRVVDASIHQSDTKEPE